MSENTGGVSIGRILWLGLVGCVLVFRLIGSCANTNAPSEGGSGTYVPANSSTNAKLVTVGYRQLIDPAALTHAGTRVVECLKEVPVPRALVQPFVDRYSELLPAVLETEGKPDGLPQRSVVDLYPVGAPQPAWVALLRGGRIHVTSDFQGHARVFLAADDPTQPQVAYEQHYPVIRHCLASLLPPSGQGLHVEVYAYENDYSTSKLKLNLNPHTLHATEFPPPAGRKPLDLTALARFFDGGGILEGASLSDSEGLVLYARRGPQQTIGGAPVSLADLAVVYRAAAHAGDNEAYISLDPSPSPTKVNVNFGGFLEDTRVGEVVLEADKRFKTISTGLDPNSLLDIRRSVRSIIPGFRTRFERMVLTNERASKGWVGTRFWFYPDSVVVEADEDQNIMRVASPFFKADAERSKDDFASAEEFRKRKQTSLSPSTRAAIDDLNESYDEYAKRFRELGELKNVARLFGICRWLKTQEGSEVDLDSLLAVELPGTSTPRMKDQLLAILVFRGDGKPTIGNISRQSKMCAVTDALDKPLVELLGGDSNIESFRKAVPSVFKGHQLQDTSVLRHKRLRQLISTKAQLLDALQAISIHLETSILTPQELEEKARLRKAREARERLVEQVESVQSSEDTSSLTELQAQLAETETTIAKLEVRDSQRIGQGDQYHSIGGGIDLGVDSIKLKTGSGSREFKQFTAINASIEPRWKVFGKAGAWTRSESTIAEGAQTVPAPSVQATVSSVQRFGPLSVRSGVARSVQVDGDLVHVRSVGGEGRVTAYVARRDSGTYEFRPATGRNYQRAVNATKEWLGVVDTARTIELTGGDAFIVIRKVNEDVYLLATPESAMPLQVRGISTAVDCIARAAKRPGAVRDGALCIDAEGFDAPQLFGLRNSTALKLEQTGTAAEVTCYGRGGGGGGKGASKPPPGGSANTGSGDEVPPHRQRFAHGNDPARVWAFGGGRRRNVVVEPQGVRATGTEWVGEFRVRGETLVRGRWQTFVSRIRVFFKNAVSGEALAQITAILQRWLSGAESRRALHQAMRGMKKDIEAVEPGARLELWMHDLGNEPADILLVEGERSREARCRSDRRYCARPHSALRWSG